MSITNNNPTKVIVPCRLSYLHAFEPDSINGSEPKYSVSCIIDKNDKETADYIKTDKAKLKKNVEELSYECQYYFGVIYETECIALQWFDGRSTKNWANGCLTELNAGYLDDEMYFEVNSYNGWNLQNRKSKCHIRF